MPRQERLDLGLEHAHDVIDLEELADLPRRHRRVATQEAERSQEQRRLGRQDREPLAAGKLRRTLRGPVRVRRRRELLCPALACVLRRQRPQA
jgi:hypothetical protein